MSDLLASLQINAPSVGLAPAAPLRAAPVALPGSAEIAPDFSAALIGLLIPGATAKTKGERQAIAEDGKDLPETPNPDPVIAWLPEGLVPVALPAEATLPAGGAAPTPMAAAAPAGLLSTSVPQADVPGLGAALASAGSGPVARASAIPASEMIPAGFEARASAPEAAGPNAVIIETAAPSPKIDLSAAAIEVDDMAISPGRFDPGSARAEARPTAPAFVTLQPAPAAQMAVTRGVAAQVFATALTPADPAPLDRVNETAIMLSGQARTEQLGTVQAMAATSQTPLDLTRDDWTGQMIDRIAALRDSAEAADTRIKLAPENLGALEVAIRRDGDRIHVHFTADNPAARQLIAEAAPRLAELADARGVKLGQTSVESGNGGQQAPQRDARQQPLATASNLSVASHAEPIADDRIA